MENNQITVTTSGNKANVNVSPDLTRYYSDLSKDWAIKTDGLVDKTDYSSKYYAQESKKQANIAVEMTTEVVTNATEALSNIETARVGALTEIINQESTSKNNVITTGNEQVERVNLTGVDNRTPIFSKSKIGTNEGVYKNLYDLKHSTFDISKFTVVGSPTITDDGVASGFSSGNYLSVNGNFNIPSAGSWEIILPKLTFGAISRYVFGTDKQYGFTLALNSYNRMQLFLSSNGTSWDIGNLSSTQSFLLNTEYRFKLSFTGAKYKLEMLEGGAWTSIISIASTAKIADFSALYIGRYHTVYATDCQADLKLFSVTVAGKEVFSGNKTGIDVIKPDNYGVVGSPVISDDGVASGFSASDYLKLPIIFQPSNKKWEIDLKITPNSINTHNDFFGSSSGTDYKHICIGVSDNGKFAIFLSSTGTSWDIASDKRGITSLVSGTTYYIKQVYDGKSYKLYSSANNIDWITEITIDKSDAIYQNTTVQALGVNKVASSRYYQFTGSIDLNAFKIYVDGNLVYQPCLKIPCTESKTGSKIVDEVYRDRVIDLYEQQGQAGYYTIDKENKNFTLPMGEIYGMIEGKAEKKDVESQLNEKADIDTPSIQAPYIKDTYVNGTSGYNIWSNGYCEQWGLSSPANSISITYLKTFRDTNYFITVTDRANDNDTGGYDNQYIAVNGGSPYDFGLATTGFRASTYNATTCIYAWKASGYLATGQY